MTVKQRSLHQGLTSAVLALSWLAMGSAASLADNRPAQGKIGFWCDTSDDKLPITAYQNAAGGVETWIEWQSTNASDLGFDPLTRCQQVSQQFETQRRAGRLKYLTHSKKNGVNVICPAKAEGECNGILFTLNPGQDPVKVLSQLLALREGTKGTPPIKM